LYRQLGGRQVVVCGGPSDDLADGPSVAEVMRDTLVKFGVSEADVLIEKRSLSTYENARNVRQLLEEQGIEKVVLVTDSRHMPRSVMCFRKQGIDVVPAASDFRPTEIPPPLYELLLPSSGGLKASRKTFHEWLGMAWYWIHGRI
jgi:uncharacterized SAM-binding protein YcdF (DUF218 family)